MAKGIDVQITAGGGGTPQTYSLERQIDGGGYSVVDGSIAYTASPQTYSDTNGGAGFSNGAIVDYKATATNTDGTSAESAVEQITISSFDADYQAILDRADVNGATKPSAPQQVIQNQLLVDMKSNGIWASEDAIYVLANDGSKEFGYINWKAPATRLLTESGAVTFTSNRGVKGDGSTGYIDTLFRESDGVNFTNTNSSASVFVKTVETVASAVIGHLFGCHAGAGAGGNYIGYRDDNTSLNWKITQNTAETVTIAADDYLGLLQIDRDDTESTNRSVLLQDGVQIDTDAATSNTTPGDFDWTLCAFNNQGTVESFNDSEIGFFSYGASDRGTAKSTLINAYMTAI